MAWRYDNTNNSNNAGLFYNGVLLPNGESLLMFPTYLTIQGIINKNEKRSADSRDSSNYIAGLLPTDSRVNTGNITFNEDDNSRVLKSDFGDGYAQVTPDGLNSNRKNWKLGWYPRKGDDTESLVNFFEHVGDHTPFIWNSFDAFGFHRLYAVIVQGSYTAASDPSDVDRTRISATFDRWFYAGSESLLGRSSDG